MTEAKLSTSRIAGEDSKPISSTVSDDGEKTLLDVNNFKSKSTKTYDAEILELLEGIKDELSKVKDLLKIIIS